MNVRQSSGGYTIKLTDREADALLSDLAYFKDAGDPSWSPLSLESESNELLLTLAAVQEEVERGRFGCE